MTYAYELSPQEVPVEAIKASLSVSKPIKIHLTQACINNIQESHENLLEGALSGLEIYGLTVGVGQNKDKEVFKSITELTTSLKPASIEFNKNLLRSHAGSIGEPFQPEVIRTAMLIRLWQYCSGHTGVSLKVAEQYQYLINNGIIPYVPRVGSIGQADILNNGFIGLFMIGEWKAHYNGGVFSFDQIRREKEELNPLQPFAKDALSIISNNSINEAIVFRHIKRLKKLIDTLIKTHIIALESLNGNVAPFSPANWYTENDQHVKALMQRVWSQTEGSYLRQNDPHRALQDPLSYRTFYRAIALLSRQLLTLELDLNNFIKGSEDNPNVTYSAQVPQGESYMERFRIKPSSNIYVIPSSNFDPILIASSLDSMSQTMTYISGLIAMQVVHLSDERMTKLTRFLRSSKQAVHSFGAIQKLILDLDSQVKSLRIPFLNTTLPIAGNIEDVGSNLPQLNSMIDSKTDLINQELSVLLLHSLQALRIRDQVYSHRTRNFLDAHKSIQIRDLDREFNTDLSFILQKLQSW